MKKKIWRLKGKIQNYAWGGNAYISELLGEEVSKEPKAEYWLGAHVNAPSMIESTEGYEYLDTFINLNLTKILGTKIANKFGRLPFLFKVLDVNEMLSIQVHPSKKEAEKGFKLENNLGIPLTAKNRNYKDDNHKPEIMVALSEFWLLHGFLPKEKLIKVLKTIPEFNLLLPTFEEKGYFGLYKQVMELTNEESNKILQPIVDRVLPLYKAGELDRTNPGYWAAKTIDSTNNTSILDKGIYSIYFFNIVMANKGEAVFQDAGIPHAYLEGQNMELMANSDNVLRGGLTPKHVDVPELLKHVSFEETHPNILLGELQKDGIERIYKSPAPDFELSQIALNSETRYQSKAKTAQVLIVIEGEAEISEGEISFVLKKGQSAFLSSESNYCITTPSFATFYKATTP
jgi:mannose-6-phosphate isomerase